MRTYDALFILPIAMDEETIGNTMTRVRDEIGRLQGEAQDPQPQGKRAFARPMKKQEAGHYVKMRFSLPPESIDTLLGRLKLNESVFRVQILRGEDGVAPAPEAAPEPTPEPESAPQPVEEPAVEPAAEPEPGPVAEEERTDG